MAIIKKYLFLPSRFSTRLIVMTLLSGLSPIIIFVLIMQIAANRFPAETSRAIQQGEEEQWRRSEAILRVMAEDFIRQKAIDVALQMDLYLGTHPEMKVVELQKDPEFRKIAIQPVGTGYTAVFDSDRAINFFHKVPAIQGMDISKTEKKWPIHWEIIKGSLGGKNSKGYYKWKDTGGKIRDKFMYIAPLNKRTGDGVRFNVAATTYVDDFFQPLSAAKEVSHHTANKLMQTVNSLILSFRDRGFFFMGLGLLLVVGLSYWVGAYFSKAITHLRNATRKVNQGHFDHHVDTTMSGDVGELIEDFNLMISQLAMTTVKKEQLETSEEKLKTAYAKLVDEISDRKRAQEALKESEENYRNLYNESKRGEQLYRSLIDSSADAIIIYDMELKTVYVSPEFTKVFGWTLEELEGKEIPFIPKNEESAARKRIKDLVEKGAPLREFETRRLTKKELVLDVSISASRYNDHDGNPAGTLMTIRDITQTRKLQAQLQHAQRLESIGMIASGVAHNFRNILAGISVNNQIMEMKFKDNSSVMEIVGRVESAVKRGAQLVDELTQFSRKQVSSEHKKINLSRTIVETYDLISESFDKKIEIQVDVPDSIPIMGDQSGLSQVILNLATNARDAMPEGGQLRIAAWNKGKQAEVVVSDTGHGMDKATTAKCFDPFFTTKDVDRGTGLGLSTTYGIIKEHGGDIHAYSEPHKGATFKIYLPLALEEEGSGKTHDPNLFLRKGKGEKILIVDDELEMLKPMEEMLESMGFKALFTGSPQEGLEKYVQWGPDVVLMDRNMPRMDGNTCVARIIEKDPDARIVLVSGYDEKGPNGIDSRTKELIKGYLTKPIHLIDLLDLLNKILNEKRGRL